MTRIEEIFLNVRDTLADPDGSRWSTPRLLRLINEAQNDIVIRAKILRDKVTVPIYSNSNTFTLPEDVFLLDRVLLNNKKLEFIDHTKLDLQQGNWEECTGTTTHLVYDKMNRRQVKLYPIPSNLSTNKYDVEAGTYKEHIYYDIDNYGFLTDGEIGDTIVGNYGLTTDVDFIDYVIVTPPCTCDGIQIFDADIESDYGPLTSITTVLKELKAYEPEYGVVTEITDFVSYTDYGLVTGFRDLDYSNFYSIYGITTDIEEVEDYLTVYYCKKPTKITSVEDELAIDSMFDSALKYYVTGKALRDDMDTQNRTVGSEELSFYERELTEIIKHDSLDFTRNDNAQYYTNYYGGI